MNDAVNCFYFVFSFFKKAANPPYLPLIEHAPSVAQAKKLLRSMFFSLKWSLKVSKTLIPLVSVFRYLANRSSSQILEPTIYQTKHKSNDWLCDSVLSSI